MQLLPRNVPPKLFTISAAVVGYILIDDTSANEQNALGNWLMLVSQTLCTNAAYEQFQQGFNSTQEGQVTGGTSTNSNSNNQTFGNSTEDTLRMLNKMVNALNTEIEEIKRSL